MGIFAVFGVLALASLVYQVFLGDQKFQSVTGQMMHYFSRPHEPWASPVWPPEELKGRAAWNGSYMAAHPEEWTIKLSPVVIADFVAWSRVPFDPPAIVPTAVDCVMSPETAGLLGRLQAELADPISGLGFSLLKGVPVSAISSQGNRTAAEALFWCLGQRLGRAGAQNRRGQLLGHVLNEFQKGSAPPVGEVRQYRTNERIDYHCDTADVVGLLCLSPGQTGGASRIVSSMSVYNALRNQNITLAEEYFEPSLLDTREESIAGGVPIRPGAWSTGPSGVPLLRSFFHVSYFASSYGNVAARKGLKGEVPPLKAALIDAVRAIGHSEALRLDMQLEEGDIQLVSNHFLMHAREAFTDTNPSGPQRHLLRLWLSLDEPHRASAPLPYRIRTAVLKELSRVEVAGSYLVAIGRAAADKIATKVASLRAAK